MDEDFGIPKITPCLVDAASLRTRSGCVVSEVPNCNLIAIHDSKDGDRLGYYLCMHCMAYKELTQELRNSSECIRYLCDFGRPTVVQLKNWSAIAQASLDTHAASLRKLH